MYENANKQNIVIPFHVRRDRSKSKSDKVARERPFTVAFDRFAPESRGHGVSFYFILYKSVSQSLAFRCSSFPSMTTDLRFAFAQRLVKTIHAIRDTKKENEGIVNWHGGNELFFF